MQRYPSLARALGLEPAEVDELVRAWKALEQRTDDLCRSADYYAELFRAGPDPKLVTDLNGVIREANAASATLLNTPSRFLSRKPLALFVPAAERYGFRHRVSRLATQCNALSWACVLRPRNASPVAAQLSARRVPGKGANAICWQVSA